MNIFSKIIIISLLTAVHAEIFAGTYRVFYKDKGPESYLNSQEIYDKTLKIHSASCLERRSKVFTQGRLVSLDDAPIYEDYVAQVANTGAKILHNLRWKNYTVVECDSSAAELIKTFSFVRDIQPTTSKLIPLKYQEMKLPEQIHYLNDRINCGNYNYGLSYNQNSLLNVTELHTYGINGQNIVIGFIDVGFRWKYHKALSSINLLGEYDFIYNDSSTANEDLDPPAQDGHGTAVLSVCAGYYPGNLIGIAPGANYMLAKTEDLRQEAHIEEDNYAAAIEWLESRGADIASSSLGYYDFDSTNEDYTYDDLNGRTSIVAQSVNEAVKRGMICITAAGNNGPWEKSIITPADADSVIAVGGIETDSAGNVSPWNGSSRGPRSDGRIKPDVAALGVSVFSAILADSTSFGFTKGTSLATPQIAGAAALIMSCFPELTPWELREILINSSTQAKNPDNIMGYGVPDVFSAIMNNGIVISPFSTYPDRIYQRVVLYLFSKRKISEAHIWVKADGASGFTPFAFKPSSKPDQYITDIPIAFFKGKPADVFITADDMLNSRRDPYLDDKSYKLEPGSTLIPCGINPSDLPILSDDAPRAYFYPSVLDNSVNSTRLRILLDKPCRLKIELYSSLGESISESDFWQTEAGLFETDLKCENLAPGKFFCRVILDNSIEIISFIKLN